ncbi:50S ribosomal protein L21 [Chlorobium phaeovibrioides]|uniref:Large ribosomal subunit protein bL21 n=2 Tax=Chlorobium phaeovibrioides TaxID=1094 RepID=RL21_CHLPM|nr:50S ribosomal protein L21 [Chlorobium phaeovibrioides]A4SFT2.1 RecName: Full=Large ribosomal subunit protein bL21; AltName: Full=50S ribosomal protein L21 [Chlorobium phaeovibrioides DSM 265]NQU46746.1 50S ribosomal protein L21 [Chlorobium sp.]KAA6232963.1 50S ribosomal protein L21 [Chlorobium phaeovibrioides]MDT9546037.1 50S ribosomal protein L21 [Chlorobium phaeovibrioides]MWV53943.1 50S ribosomal protein L21 [Chlorobium phaeovibrioides]QEQ56643.1 50S ribosomal protein L21 [Chlorobium ph
MQALIKISDKQYLVQKGDTLFVPRQKTDIGGTMEIASMARIDGANTVLNPAETVTAKVLGHVKDDKVVVFKKKRRKRYQSRNGHRQQMTQIEVVSL